MTELNIYLRALWHDAGLPSTRTIAQQCTISHSAVYEILNGKRPPRWESVQQIVGALDGELPEARSLWMKETGGTVTRKRPAASLAPMPLTCCICLYDLRASEVKPADTVIEGFAVCTSHMGYVAQGNRWRSIMQAVER